mmetsp:Transcript_128703/g.181542  ORF Transcript_128703/g.181542 Transcript_128703/m.181542 type:complete len:393 (-) Transcript_128703:677-1855(-)
MYIASQVPLASLSSLSKYCDLAACLGHNRDAPRDLGQRAQVGVGQRGKAAEGGRRCRGLRDLEARGGLQVQSLCLFASGLGVGFVGIRPQISENGPGECGFGGQGLHMIRSQAGLAEVGHLTAQGQGFCSSCLALLAAKDGCELRTGCQGVWVGRAEGSASTLYHLPYECLFAIRLSDFRQSQEELTLAAATALPVHRCQGVETLPNLLIKLLCLTWVVRLQDKSQASEGCQRVGVAGSKLLLAARNHFAQVRFGLAEARLVSLLRQNVRQLTSSLQSVRIVAAEGDVALVHQVLKHLLSIGQTSLAADDICEVCLGSQSIGVLGPQGALAHLEHLLVHGLAFLEVAHLGPQRCEVELGRCDIPVLGPKFRLELLANLDVHLLGLLELLTLL